MTSGPGPGWYSDPRGPGQRYWDGSNWTEHHLEPPPSPQALRDSSRWTRAWLRLSDWCNTRGWSPEVVALGVGALVLVVVVSTIALAVAATSETFCEEFAREYVEESGEPEEFYEVALRECRRDLGPDAMGGTGVGPRAIEGGRS